MSKPNLHAYLEASGLNQEPKALFPTIAAGTDRGRQLLTRRATTPREAHATRLYDRRADDISLYDFERILI